MVLNAFNTIYRVFKLVTTFLQLIVKSFKMNLFDIKIFINLQKTQKYFSKFNFKFNKKLNNFSKWHR